MCRVQGQQVALCSRAQFVTWKQRLHAWASRSMGGSDRLRPSRAASTFRCMIRLATCRAHPMAFQTMQPKGAPEGCRACMTPSRALPHGKAHDISEHFLTSSMLQSQTSRVGRSSEKAPHMVIG